jgi:hypothetical protein
MIKLFIELQKEPQCFITSFEPKVVRALNIIQETEDFSGFHLYDGTQVAENLPF